MSSYWKDAEAAFIAQAQDAALGPRKRKKNLPKGAPIYRYHTIDIPAVW